MTPLEGSVAKAWTRLVRVAVMSVTCALALPAAAENGVSGQVEVTSSTSAKEKLDFARSSLSEMDDSIKRAEKLLDLAEKDTSPDAADQIQCVRLKLASIKTLRQVSERAQGSMSEAIADGNDPLADHEFRKIAVATSKVRQFIAEAEACMGEAGAADGTTDVDVDAEGITDAEETEPLTGDLGDIAVDPPGVSPHE